MSEIPADILAKAIEVYHDTAQDPVQAIALAITAERNSHASLTQELDRMRDENSRLMEALKPFRDMAGMLPATYGPDYEPIPSDEDVHVTCCGFPLGELTVADLNKVYAALEPRS